MNGELNAEQQMAVLAKIWGNDRDGYVFLPWIDGSANTIARRRRGYHEGRAFEWPRERPEILAHLGGHSADDVYFTPALFNAKRRTEQNVDAERTLWADLDPVNPATLGDLRPTIAWESSPGRYQGVWILDRARVGASWPSKENHRLSLHIGADPSGWDSTQLLRVPGRQNHKFVYGERGVPGRLLWDNGPRYVWEDFDDLPEVGIVAGEDIDLLDDDLIAGIDRHKLWSTVRLKVSHRIREYMSLKTHPAGADRSSVLWEIERELADAGCSIIEIIALVRPSIWNKYAGRNDELRRLKTEAAKAIAARPDELERPDDEVAKPNILWLSTLTAQPIPRPQWLVENVWTRGGCGFIAGAPKSYKSWLALDLAVSVATGTPWLGMAGYHVRIPRPVLYVQEEDDLRLVMSRLAVITEAKAPSLFWRGSVALYGGGDATPRVTQGRRVRSAYRATWSPPEGDVPLAVHVQTGFISSDPGWQAWLADTIAEGKFALVIIDTLGTTAGDVDTDRSGDLMTKLLKPLKITGQQHNAGICLVHHNKKASSDGKERAGNQMLGSVALHAWVDCAIYARAREGGEIFLEREAKFAPELSMRVRIPRMFENHHTGERQLWEPELIVPENVSDQNDVKQPPPKNSSEQRRRGMSAASIRLRMKHSGKGPFTAEHLQALGISKASLDQALSEGIVYCPSDGLYALVSDE